MSNFVQGANSSGRSNALAKNFSQGVSSLEVDTIGSAVVKNERIEDIGPYIFLLCEKVTSQVSRRSKD